MRRPEAAEASCWQQWQSVMQCATAIGRAGSHGRGAWTRRRAAAARVAGRARGGQAHWAVVGRATSREPTDRIGKSDRRHLALAAAARSARAAVRGAERHAADRPRRSAGDVDPPTAAASGRRHTVMECPSSECPAVNAPCPGREGETVRSWAVRAQRPCRAMPPPACAGAGVVKPWAVTCATLYACPVWALRMALGPRAASRMAPGMSAYVSAAARSPCGRTAPSRVDFVL